MKTLMNIMILVLISSSSVAVGTTELRCKNFHGERLDWTFNIVSTPELKSGVLEGALTKLTLLVDDQVHEYGDRFAAVSRAEYWQEEGYSDVTVTLPQNSDLSLLNVHLNGELWDLMGSSNPDDIGKIFIDPGQIRLKFKSGKVLDREFICAMLLNPAKSE